MPDQDTHTSASVPAAHPSFDALVQTIWRLRQPDGCPWDREQTHESIERNMIEEAYEAVDAIEQHDQAHLREELGDVLMQVLLHAQIDADEGGFTIDDVCAELNEKLIRRHPHVFGDVDASDPEEALASWDEVKRQEREAAGKASSNAAEPGLLDSIPRAMPALMQCQKISKRAAKAGFDWPTTADVWQQMASERAEFEAEEPASAAAAEEFGDILFSLVNVARREHIDAEAALRASNDKFRRRWDAMEKIAGQRGVELAELSFEDLNALIPGPWSEKRIVFQRCCWRS